ncbi:MAG: FAD:protein FMN transferase, partial [Mizugakiibacter sp.]|uniref:FAD:protein FMN transferase n=1 Tax=Mizugakiibacter sp. TaxID=1972610 RepID=UPI00320E71AF
MRTAATRTLALAAAGAAVVLLAALALRGPQPPARAEFFVFGGLTAVELRGTTPAHARGAFAAIDTLLRQDERDWHPWQPSALMRLNAALARGEPMRAPGDLAGLIRRAQWGYRASAGLFDPAIGALIEAWGFHTSDYPITTPPPSRARVDALLAARPTMDDVGVAADGTVGSRNRAVQLDLNGLAEGYAAEQVAALLRARGIADAIVNVGGDVLALGTADGRRWRVAIEDPRGKAPLAVAELAGHEALFTSGDYHKYREIDGRRWAHILDPRDGLPLHGAAAATAVIAGDAVVADIASTTLMIAGPERFAAAARGLGVNCALLLTHDGRLYLTPSMRAPGDLAGLIR